MAVMSSIVLFVLGVIGAAASRILADEFKDWTPYIVDKLIKRAVAKLPKQQQDRFDEEWRSYINDIPGQIGKLWQAFGLLSAAKKIRSLVTIRTVSQDVSLAFIMLLKSLVSGLVAAYITFRITAGVFGHWFFIIGAGLLWMGFTLKFDSSLLLGINATKSGKRMGFRIALRVPLIIVLAITVSKPVCLMISQGVLDQELNNINREGTNHTQVAKFSEQNRNSNAEVRLQLPMSKRPSLVDEYQMLRRIEGDPSHPYAATLSHLEWALTLLFFILELTPITFALVAIRMPKVNHRNVGE